MESFYKTTTLIFILNVVAVKNANIDTFTLRSAVSSSWNEDVEKHSAVLDSSTVHFDYYSTDINGRGDGMDSRYSTWIDFKTSENSTSGFLGTAPSKGGGPPGLSVDVRPCLICIGCVGMITNGFVIIVLALAKGDKKNMTNLLIINQSAIDFVACFLLIQGNIVTYFNLHLSGFMGDLYCRVFFNQMILLCVNVCSTYNLVAMTLERYIMIIYPLQAKAVVTWQKVIGVMISVWLIGFVNLVINAPLLQGPVDGGCNPIGSFIKEVDLMAKSIADIILTFVLPIGVFIFCYGHMVYRLHRRTKIIHPAMVNNPQSVSKAQVNTFKTMLLVCVAFGICWTPLQLVFICMFLGLMWPPAQYLSIIMGNCNLIINPFIYIIRYQSFQKQAKKLFKRGQTYDLSNTASSS